MTIGPARSTVTWQDRLMDRWDGIKPAALALAIGLVAGPLVSNFAGWQVTRSSADRQIHLAAVEQQAMICAVLARAQTADIAGMDWSARRDLAEKFAVMPGRSIAAPDVASACGTILAGPG